MIKINRVKLEEPIPVYDLTVESTESFFANDTLVHNCAEILLESQPFTRLDDENGRISLCTLGSINWGSFRNPEDMRRACKILHRSLNNILEYQDFLSVQSYNSNQEIRPLGIGVTNLAYWHAKRKLKYGEEDALNEVKSWMEHQAYYLTEASVELAEERGPCGNSSNTWYGRGVFPWERRASGVNELTDFSPELDWEPLREKMKEVGVRNATLMAIAPVESCQSWRNKLNFANGDRKNFHEMLEDQNIDWQQIENQCEPGTSITLETPIEITGVDGVETVSSVVYNGLSPVNTITFEDGSVMNFTDNHRLLVNRDGVEQWVYVYDLQEHSDLVVSKDDDMPIRKIDKHSHQEHTWDITTPSGTFLLPNGCVSHNSSVVINSTNGIEMPMSLISVKESKAGSLIQVVPEYHRLKNRYQLMWDQTDCIDYLKTAAVLAAYVDQSISTNTFYNPSHFENKKVPSTLVAKNLMLGHYYGLKTFYYSLINKAGSKADAEPIPHTLDPIDFDDEESCESCIL